MNQEFLGNITANLISNGITQEAAKLLANLISFLHEEELRRGKMVLHIEFDTLQTFEFKSEISLALKPTPEVTLN